MRGEGSRVNVRKEIMHYFFHPRVGYLERRSINKALKLADFYSIKSVRSNPSLQVRGMSNIKSGLKLLEDLSQDNAYILRESDKNLGWSLNTSIWYNQEYDRHLKSGFYQKVRSMGDVDNIKHSCRLFLQAILRWLDIVFQGQYLTCLSVNYVDISKDLEKLIWKEFCVYK